jgi:hypothetical protein
VAALIESLRRTHVSAPLDDHRPAAQTAKDSGPGAGLYLAFVPWVLFTLITQHDSLIAASVVALVAAAAISLPALLKGHPKLMELAAVAAFAAFTITAAVADPATSTTIARYARAIAAAVLALTAFGSLLFVPFTEQYARDAVPRQFWNSPQFKRINRQLTAMWGLVFTAMVPSHLIAGAIDTRRANTIFNWVIPIALVVWAAKRTAAVTSNAKAS